MRGETFSKYTIQEKIASAEEKLTMCLAKQIFCFLTIRNF